MSDPQPPRLHQRSKSAVTRAFKRASGAVPTLNSLNQSVPDETSAMNSPTETRFSADGNLLPPPSRASLQAGSRPHLSTTMSNTHNTSFLPSPTRDAQPIVPTNTTHGTSIEQSVRLFKVFEVLRNGDTAAIAKAARETAGAKLDGTTILHLAIQCADVSVIEYVLAQQGTNLNAKDRDGNTPLHLASMLSRVPVVKLLLDRSETQDTVVNFAGKTALDLARSPDIFQQLQLARSIFIEEHVRKVQQLVTSGDYDALESLISESRVKAALDINNPDLATDQVTVAEGGSLLHEAARKKDIKLAQLLLINGADPFKRDRHGKLPQDVTKDERTRAILKRSPAAAVAQRSIQEKTIIGDGNSVLSSDAGPSSKESREMKGYLRKWTNYTSGYKLRWFVLEDGVLSYYKHQDDTGSACRGAINMRIARLIMDPKEKLHFELHGKSSVKYDLKANHEVEAKRWFWALNNAIQWSKDEARSEQKRQQTEAKELRDATSEKLERQRTRDAENTHGTAFPSATASLTVVGSATSQAGSAMGQAMSGYEPSEADTAAIRDPNIVNIAGDQDDDDDYGEDASINEARPAGKDAFSITAQSARLQLELLDQVSAALSTEKAKNPDLGIGSPTVSQALSSYDTAVGNLKGLLMDLLRISRDHEAFWQYRLEREQNIRRLWEDSMARLAHEQEALESRIGESENKRKRTKRALKEALENNAIISRQGTPDESVEQVGKPVLELPANINTSGRRSTLPGLADLNISDDEAEDEEEFFDAVDAGEVEVVEVMPSVVPVGQQTALFDTDAKVVESGVEEERYSKAREIAKSYAGYEDGVRKRYKIDADNRPKVSLWGILKSMIGKDMTKMTLPVSFNEPTSLLYRVVEDMEYTSLLDIAADRADSTERLVYVAGFAASEYASTTGRVAKPFNPLLGETYEYVRPDLGYRFFIEQVSHHPPVGAAYAESAKWDYYGESAVKSKFYGKSFEFNPLGTWFLHIRPSNGAPEELYTWKKVTSSVVGIITGNPSVDNYGLMEVRNWTTGEVCYLDFKAKGWKASSAFQVQGKVVDAEGKTRWSIGGRWNDKIYARLTPGYEGSVEPGAGDLFPNNQAFLVWEAHYRPPPGEIPFNVTPFVVTLNDIPDRLRPCIAPTDSRLRPDQRAMEEGEYDFAAVEKNRVEEGQRARRRIREARGEEFVPRWFKKANHPVTGEEFWEFNHEYWKVRAAVTDGKRTWEDEKLEEIY